MHYCKENRVIVTSRNFQEYWKNTLACRRDGCSSVRVYRMANEGAKATKRKVDSFMNTESGTKKRPYCPSYTVNAFDMGIDHWEVWVPKKKVIDHKVRDAVEIHEYKSKPSKILKGGTLKEMHRYVIDYDGRCYDPLEHGGISADDSFWKKDRSNEPVQIRVNSIKREGMER